MANKLGDRSTRPHRAPPNNSCVPDVLEVKATFRSDPAIYPPILNFVFLGFHIITQLYPFG